MGVIGEIAALDADGMYLLDVLSYCHESRHGTEWLTEIVGIKACNDDAFAFVGKGLHNRNNVFVKELCLVNAYDLNIVLQGLQHCCSCCYRTALDALGVMRNDIALRVSDIDSRLEDCDLLIGEPCSFETADKFLGLAGEHGTAYYFNATCFFRIFRKHCITFV